MGTRNRTLGFALIAIGIANVIIFRRSAPGLTGGIAFVVLGIVLLARSRQER